MGGSLVKNEKLRVSFEIYGPQNQSRMKKFNQRLGQLLTGYKAKVKNGRYRKPKSARGKDIAGRRMKK